MREGIHGEDPDGEEIRLDDGVAKPGLNPAGLTQVLEELQAQLAEKNLPEAEVEKLIEDPEAFLRTRTGDDYAALKIIRAVASLYFKTLHLRAVEGEAFTDARLLQALKMARTRTLEAIADSVQQCADLNLILRTAELVSKD